MLTLREIAEQLGLPESTVRYYRDRFSAFVPTVGRGRQRRYREEAVDVLRAVAEGLRNQKSAEEVEELLAAQFPRYVELEEEGEVSREPALPNSWMMAFMLVQGQALQQLSENVRERQETSRKMGVLEEELGDLKRRLAETVEARLARLEERDRVVVAQMRAYFDQASRGNKVPWWQRWTGAKAAESKSTRSPRLS
jgi:DNA-binding transcriptional MerR regulator